MEKLFKELNNVCEEEGKLNLKSDALKKVLNDFYDLEWEIYAETIDEDDESIYKRVKIHKNKKYNFELFIITWKPFEECQFHNHPENGCIFKVLGGRIKETIYSNVMEGVRSVREREFGDNDGVSYIDNKIGFHKIENMNGDEYSYSIHLYSPCEFKTTFFDI